MAEIYIYASDCEDFSNFGLAGALTPTECVFEEEGNGMSELTLTHPLDDFGRYTALVRDRILSAEVPVRTTPEINGGSIVTSVEQWKVRSASTITKKMRYLYKRKSGSSKLKVLPGGTTVTVVNKPEDGRYKVKCRYGTGYMDPNGLEYSTTETIADNSRSIESVQPAWTVKTQYFRIYSVEKGIDSVTVSARHISYDLLYNLTNYKTTAAVSCKTALAGIMDGCYAAHEFEAFTNLDDTRTGLSWVRVNPINALLDPDEGLTAKYGAALVRDNWELYILHDPGLNRGVTVEYAKNMTGIKCTESAEDVVTRVVPLGETKAGDDLLLSGNAPWVDSPHIDDYPTPRIQVLKCENCKVGTDSVTTAIARARMKEQAQAVFDNGGDLPEIEMSVEFVSLGDTAEYAQYKDLDRLFLWDYVIIRHKKQNIDVTARVVSIKWDCLRGRMRSMEIGKVGKTLANSGITTWQIPSGFSGSKIASGTVGSAALQADIINLKHMQADSVNADAIQAGSITTNKLAASSVTAEKLAAGAVDAGALSAVTAKIGSLTAKDIETDSLAAALAAFTVVTAGTAEFDRATVAHLVAQALNLDFGTAGTVYIQNLAVQYAQMVGAAIGNLCIKASDGNYYTIDVNRNGSVTATKATVSAGEIAAGQTSGGQVILETNITAANLNAGNLLATYALVNRIDAARLDVDELFARKAFIDMLRTSKIFAGKSLEIIVDETENASRVFRQEEFPDSDTYVKPGDLLVKPSTGAQYQAVETGEITFLLDENGNLYYDYDGEGSLSVDGFGLYAEGFELSITEDGRVGTPYNWVLVRDLELEDAANAAQSAADDAQETADMAGNYANEALDKANAALSQADFQRVVRIDDEGLHVGDNLTDMEVLLDSASVNVVVEGVKAATFSDKFIRLGNMQVRKVRGGLAISVYNS